MLTTKLILERFDKDHELLERIEKPSRSFLIQFIELNYVLAAQILDPAPYSMQDIGNNARDVDVDALVAVDIRAKICTLCVGGPGGASWCCYPSGRGSGIYSAPGDEEHVGDTIGIVVGTDNTPVAPDDYALGTQIAHGEAAGELLYGGTELYGVTVVNPNASFTIRRYFTNASGGGITVEEVGIYSLGSDSGVGTMWSFCIARDVTGGVAVADTEILRVTYVPQITV
jgi:hypothetical protein